MQAVKLKYEIYGVKDSLSEYVDGFTIACKKPVSRVVLRRFMARTMEQCGLKNIKIMYGTDDPSGGKRTIGSISWHISFNKDLTKNQVSQITTKLEEFRRTQKLGEPSLFLRWGIFSAGEYIAKHQYIDIQKVI